MSSDVYILANNVLVRKEWFGCLAANNMTGHFLQMDSDAFVILSRLIEAQSLEGLIHQLSADDYSLEQQDLRAFLESMMSSGIVDANIERTNARVLFADRHSFRSDCLVVPSSVTLYMTERCTKRCKHCIVRSNPFVSYSNELSIEQWTVALDKLHSAGVFAVVFTGGEPLLKEGIFEILRYADRLGLGISLMTDYDRLNKTHLQQLKNLQHLADLQTSLDGATEQIHDFIRGTGSYKCALRRLMLLKDSGLQYTVSSAIGKHNLNQLSDIAELAKENGATYYYVNPLAPYGRAKKYLADYILSPEQLQYLGHEYYRLAQAGLVNTGNPFWQATTHDMAAFNPFNDVLDAVSLGICNISIGSRGECYLDSKMKSEQLLYLGNIVHDELEQMWGDKRLDQLRMQYDMTGRTYANRSIFDW